MASNREGPLSYANTPSSSSSPIAVSDHLDATFLTVDPSGSHLGSASNSFQNDAGFLNESASSSDAEFGFSTPELRQSPLAGTVQFYERHVFLCYKNPSVWPPRIEAAEFDRLPRLLSAAVMARKGDLKKEAYFPLCSSCGRFLASVLIRVTVVLVHRSGFLLMACGLVQCDLKACDL
ncbi:hypothetical protein P3X46_027344 [Hevea brasiliensis]|uniref:Uncharacterized protein n=1 Tax=Hevea brasiliensis TaxID=3981 RepID=A0ABQ9L130_HEVBR|nr:uncharacterized protein LOC110671640 [Hevea brasiliensis]KAJ9153959.1 hypothetical protein P3X46_027344 [Hevea brasiliensis]